MVGSEQAGLEAETGWPDAAKSRLPSEPSELEEGDDLASSDQLLPSSQLAALQPDKLLASQKLSATTLKCPGSGGANLQLWPAPLSRSRFVRSGVVASSGGRVATRVCRASSFLPGWRGPRASVGEKLVVGEWSWLVLVT